MTPIDVLPAAQSEFREGVAWYRERNSRTARRFALEVKSAIAAIRQYPERYPHWDEVHRFYLVNDFPYYVAYRQVQDSVQIVAIRHAAQDQDAWKGR